MIIFPFSRHAVPLTALLFATSLLAAPPEAATTIELSAEASATAANDLARATVFAEASGNAPGELARRVNGLLADALKTARAYPSVRTQSGMTHTYPVHGKASRIEGWRMRSDLALESGDTAALSELLGKLQATMGVASLSMLPAPETRKKAENQAMVDAIAAFQERAGVVAAALGSKHRIRSLTINSSGRPPIAPIMRSAVMMAAEAAPMPIEAGETQITATVSGQIELLAR